MNTIKEWFGYIIAAFMGIIGVLLYFLKGKDEEIDVGAAKEKLADTDKKVAVIENDLKHLEEKKKTVEKDIDKADTELQSLQKDREDNKKDQIGKNPQEIEEFWTKH